MSAAFSYVIASILLLALAAGGSRNPATPEHGMLVVANQGDHTALLIDPQTREELMKVSRWNQRARSRRVARLAIRLCSHLRQFRRRQTRHRRPVHRHHRFARTTSRSPPSTSVNPSVLTAPNSVPMVCYTSPRSSTTPSTSSIRPPAKSSRKSPPAPIGIPHVRHFSRWPACLHGECRRWQRQRSGPQESAVSSLSSTLQKPSSAFPLLRRRQARLHARSRHPRIAVIDTCHEQDRQLDSVPSTVYSSSPTPDGRKLTSHLLRWKTLRHRSGQRQSLTSPSTSRPPIGEVLITPDGKFAFVSCPQAGVIEVFDVHANKLLQPIKLTRGVDGLAWAPAIP